MTCIASSICSSHHHSNANGLKPTLGLSFLFYPVRGMKVISFHKPEAYKLLIQTPNVNQCICDQLQAVRELLDVQRQCFSSQESYSDPVSAEKVRTILT